MPLILPGNVATATAPTTYQVANSCRFNDGDSAYLTRDLGTSTAGSGKKFTFSAWVKRGILGTDQYLFSSKVSTHQADLCFKDDDTLRFRLIYGGTTYGHLRTNAKYRDVSAWYHIVVNMDTTQSTDTNRTKMYVNGSQVTSFSTSTRPNQDSTFTVNNNTVNNQDHSFGRNEDGPGDYFDGYMAEVVWIDGTAYAASDFGEYDEDTPQIWIPKDVSGLTFGTHGVYLDFEDSGDLDDDESGNGNDFTATNLAAADQATDSCTNNFATMNYLDNYYASSTFSEGNCTIVQGSSTYAHNSSTIAVTAGKWYVEAKLTTDSEHALVGITDTPPLGTGTKILGSAAHDYSIKQANGDLFNNRGDDPANDATDYAAAYAQNDIIGIALDCDNNKLYFSKGGAWSDGSGSWDSTTFNASVGAITITAPASTDNGHYFFASGDYGSASCTWEWNFGGCPPFSISSGNTDGKYGNFEYAVPSGFLALCTKNLGSDGG